MQELSELNENIKETYLPLLDRFYKLFEGTRCPTQPSAPTMRR
jgi:hypothetical protein